MGFFMVKAASVNGLGVEIIQVEADISNGLPVLHLVGYLSSEVKEAAERVRTALRNTGVQLPAKRIMINLSPAYVRKRGTMFDLPIAVAILAALEEIPSTRLEDALFVGELGLDGKIRGIEGILPIVIEAKERGIKCCVIPKENVREGRLIEGIDIFGAEDLKVVCEWTKGRRLPCTATEEIHHNKNELYRRDIDYSEILGQEFVKRATLVAVAGNHNLLYIGPPGAGKTMLAKRIPSILPELTFEESLELTKIYSFAGLIQNEDPLIKVRPFREVHHTATKASLVGGGRIPSPGEVTLANGGVLFLDELAEFPRNVLEVLRQPLEEKIVHMVRQQGAYVFPADFMLVAAMNPCPCGNYPDLGKCTCTLPQIQKYLGKISQPFLDRIDICVETPKVEYEELVGNQKVQDSSEMRRQVEMAREIQSHRFHGSLLYTNAQMSKKEIQTYCNLSKRGEQLMRQAYEVYQLTARSYFKILKVARTIADLSAETNITEEHLQEAISYRMLDKKYWGS